MAGLDLFSTSGPMFLDKAHLLLHYKHKMPLGALESPCLGTAGGARNRYMSTSLRTTLDHPQSRVNQDKEWHIN